MVYQVIANASTEYAVDWSCIECMARSHRLSQSQLQHSEIVKESDRSSYNPFSWGLPDIYSLDVNWAKVRSEAATNVKSDLTMYRSMAKHDLQTVAKELEWKLGETAGNKRTFKNKLFSAQQSTMQEVDASVQDYDTSIGIAKFIRDMSAEFVIAGSAILSGGASVVALGAGSTLKGSFKYQDTGNIGAATIHGVGSFVLGAFKVDGNKLSKAGDIVLIIAKGGVESTTAFISGETFANSVKSGIIKVASAGGAYTLLNGAIAGKALEKLVMPSTISVVGTGGSVAVRALTQSTVSRDMTKKMLEKATEYVSKSGLKSFGSSDSPANTLMTNSVLLEAPIEQKMLLHLSIVNMEKGIGRGW